MKERVFLTLILGWTPLHCVCEGAGGEMKDRIEIVKMLLADPALKVQKKRKLLFKYYFIINNIYLFR
jgi:hypothetical protein